jgi:rubrerythrin
MASESSTERTVSVTLPAELDEWLDERAGALDVDREQLLHQLLASYRTASELDGDGESSSLRIEGLTVEGTVEDHLDDALDDRLAEQLTDAVDDRLDERLEAEVQELVASAVADALEERVQEQVEAVLTDQVNEATTSVQRQLTNRIDTVESEFDEKIEDVRDRVIQVKKEADGKAAEDHHHDEQFRELEELSDTVAEMESELEGLREEFDATVPDNEQQLAAVDDRLGEVQDRLQTVAWVVSDLREAHESNGGLEAVERIKRAAAKADVERANCQNCGDGVTLSLLTDPECPHCNATVTNVEPAGGWFGKPKLVTASQLESGEQE